MTKLGPLNDILNDTPADATFVDQNYDSIRSYVNNELINADGSVAMAAPLRLVGDPTNAGDATTKSYVDAILPVGVMLPYCGVTSPAGSWAVCNGASLTATGYPKLFAVIGTRFGSGSGTFLLPNMQGRMAIGQWASKADFDTVGKAGGAYAAPLPQHHHTFSHTHTMDHNHGQVVSGNSNQAMTHAHSIAHDHPNGTLSTVTTSTPGTVQHLMIGSSTGTVSTMPFNVPGIDTTNLSGPGNLTQVHTHNVDLPNYAGSTGNTSVAGAVTSDTGVAGVEHVPPYVTVIYIIRID